jgi:hypothetical protein
LRFSQPCNIREDSNLQWSHEWAIRRTKNICNGKLNFWQLLPFIRLLAYFGSTWWSRQVLLNHMAAFVLRRLSLVFLYSCALRARHGQHKLLRAVNWTRFTLKPGYSRIVLLSSLFMCSGHFFSTALYELLPLKSDSRPCLGNSDCSVVSKAYEYISNFDIAKHSMGLCFPNLFSAILHASWAFILIATLLLQMQIYFPTQTQLCLLCWTGRQLNSLVSNKREDMFGWYESNVFLSILIWVISVCSSKYSDNKPQNKWCSVQNIYRLYTKEWCGFKS